MMELTSGQWVRHVVLHPFEGFEDVRWKKAGSVRITCGILALWFLGAVLYSRMYGFQFRATSDKLFNVIPYLVQTVILFLTWTVGNWAVCTLLDGEGTMRNIFVYSAYALVPYVTSLYAETLLSHILIRDEAIFLTIIHDVGLWWSVLLVISAVKTVHQYSVMRTLFAILLTIAAMLAMLFLMVLVLSLFQQVYVFIYSIYTEVVYRFRV